MVKIMEEKESILYVILIAVTLLIVPDSLNKEHPLHSISVLAILIAILLLSVALTLVAVKNIPPLSPYLPEGLGDNMVKLLAWTGVFIVGILSIIIHLISAGG
jgi:hypothetical protein